MFLIGYRAKYKLILRDKMGENTTVLEYCVIRYISVILNVLSICSSISSTNKTVRYEITEILTKSGVKPNTISTEV